MGLMHTDVKMRVTPSPARKEIERYGKVLVGRVNVEYYALTQTGN